MEGRAIARPNRGGRSRSGLAASTLQWRAGQLPGQTPVRHPRLRRPRHPSMEGRAIARPNLNTASHSSPAGRPPFNGGPGNCPAKQENVSPRDITELVLQWRAGQLPGQTRRSTALCGGGRGPSMEGRAIARPNPMHVGAFGGVVVPSMEGRAIARPNCGDWPATSPARCALQWRAGQLPGQTRRRRQHRRRHHRPSMEGRAIARPNTRSSRRAGALGIALQWRAGQLPGQTPAPPLRSEGHQSPFNGGPGNCPAKHAGSSSPRHCPGGLQWRAGQLPGQTRPQRRAGPKRSAFNGGPGNCPAKRRCCRWCLRRCCPSMEGRAIARPNRRRPAGEWGHEPRLQWRAGQLPGQTHKGRGVAWTDPAPSMEGRAIARPNRESFPVGSTYRDPSMEGRAIARPNMTGPSAIAGTACTTPSMEGRAIARPNLSTSTFSPAATQSFNGGPGNCPAKPGAGLARRPLRPEPSMEGRAIARPNYCVIVRSACLLESFNGGPGNCPAKPETR